MAIPNVVGNIAGAAQQQRYAVANFERELAAKKEADAKALRDQILTGLLNTGINTAVDFGKKAYDESTTGARAQADLAIRQAEEGRNKEKYGLGLAEAYPTMFGYTPEEPAASAPTPTPAPAPDPARTAALNAFQETLGPIGKAPMPAWYTSTFGTPKLKSQEDPPAPPPPAPAPTAAPQPAAPALPFSAMTPEERQLQVGKLAGAKAAESAKAAADKEAFRRKAIMETQATQRLGQQGAANQAPIKYDKRGNVLAARPKTYTGAKDTEWGPVTQFTDTVIPERAAGGSAGGSSGMPDAMKDVVLNLQYARLGKGGRPEKGAFSANTFNGQSIWRIINSSPITFGLSPTEAADVRAAYAAGDVEAANRMLVASAEDMSKGKANIGDAGATSAADIERRAQDKADKEAAAAERKAAKDELAKMREEKSQAAASDKADRTARAAALAEVLAGQPKADGKRSFLGKNKAPALDARGNPPLTREQAVSAINGDKAPTPELQPAYDFARKSYLRRVQAAPSARPSAGARAAQPANGGASSRQQMVDDILNEAAQDIAAEPGREAEIRARAKATIAALPKE